MAPRTLLAALVLLMMPLLVACSPSWQVLHQTSPDTFINQREFAVMPVDFTGLRVGEVDEMTYLSEKDDDSRRSWVGDKLSINERFADHLMTGALKRGIRVVLATGPASAPFLIRPSVPWIEPGYFVGVASGASQVRMLVRITTPDGAILEEVLFEHATGGSLARPSISSRLEEDAEGLGEALAEYLQTRVAPGQDD